MPLRAAALVAFSITLLLALVYFGPDVLFDRLADGARDGAAASRVDFWKETLFLIRDYPIFGSGLGTYASAIQRYRSTAPLLLLDFAHNDYLQILAELGLLGAAPLFLCAGYSVRCAIRAAVSALDSPNREMAAACAASMVAIAVHSLADFNLYIPANAMVLAWVAGLGCALHTRAELTSRSVPVIPAQTVL